MSNVFVSYVREDLAVVRKLVDYLKGYGIKVWFDHDSISPGLPWKQAIAKGIKEGAFFIACFSRAVSERDKSHIFEEINIAIEELRQRPPAKPWFLSVRLDDCVIPDIAINATSTIRDLQWVDLFPNWDASARALVKAIGPFGSTDAIREALMLFGINDYGSARAMLNNIASAGVDLPPRVKYLLDYNLACAESRLAAEPGSRSTEIESLLDSSANHLLKWMSFGIQGAWSALDRTADDQINAMTHDDDLLFVLSAKESRLRNVAEQYLGKKITWPTMPSGRSGGGCVVYGTSIATTRGPRPIEQIRIGDEIFSSSGGSTPHASITVRVKAIHFGRAAKCIRVNGQLSATPGHRVLVGERGWTALADLEIGDRLSSFDVASQAFVDLIQIEDGYFETFALTTDHGTHNYWTGNILSHNMKE